MKIRMDYVTNSSSSSYVIAYKENFPNIDEETLKKYPWLEAIKENMLEYIITTSSYYETEEAHKINDIDDLESYIKDEYGYSCTYRNIPVTVENVIKIEGDSIQKFYDEVKMQLDKGYNVLIKRVGYSDYMLDGIINKLSETENEDFMIISVSEY